MWIYFTVCIFVWFLSSSPLSDVRISPRGWGEVLYKVSWVEDLPWGPAPYPFVNHFDRKATSFVYFNWKKRPFYIFHNRPLSWINHQKGKANHKSKWPLKHQPTAWPVAYACAKPYCPSSGYGCSVDKFDDTAIKCVGAKFFKALLNY